MTTVVAVVELLAGFGSLPSAWTEAVLPSVPVVVGRPFTMIVTVTLAPTFTVPRLQVILPPTIPPHVPCVAPAELSVTPAGSASVKTTLVAYVEGIGMGRLVILIE